MEIFIIPIFWITFLQLCRSSNDLKFQNIALSKGSSFQNIFIGRFERGNSYLMYLFKDIKDLTNINVYNPISKIETYSNNTAKFIIDNNIEEYDAYGSCISYDYTYLTCSLFNSIGNISCTTNSDTTSRHIFTVGNSVNITCTFNYTGAYKPIINFSFPSSNSATTSTSIDLSDTSITTHHSYVAKRADPRTTMKLNSSFSSELMFDVQYTHKFSKDLAAKNTPIIVHNSDIAFIRHVSMQFEYQEKATINSIQYTDVMYVGQQITIDVAGKPSPTIEWTDLETNGVFAKLVLFQRYLEKSRYSFKVEVCNKLIYNETYGDHCDTREIQFTVLAATTPSTTTTSTTTISPSMAGLKTTPQAVKPKDSKMGLILGLVFGLLAIVIIAAIVWFCMKRRGKNEEVKEVPNYMSNKKSNIEKMYPMNSEDNFSTNKSSPLDNSQNHSATLKGVTGVDDHLHTIDDVPRSRRPLKVFEPNNDML